MKTSGGKGLHLSIPLNSRRCDARRDQAVRAGARPGARSARPEARHGRHGQGQAAEPRVRRLEPERQPQDNRVRVLVAHPGAADGVDAGFVGRGRSRGRRGRRGRTHVRNGRRRRTRRAARRPVRRRRSPCTRSFRRSRFAREEPRWIRTGRDRHRREPRRRSGDGVAARARAGCKVACAARATDASPLPIPGTIDETVRRITDAGGDALAVPTNLADDASIDAWSQPRSPCTDGSTCS